MKVPIIFVTADDLKCIKEMEPSQLREYIKIQCFPKPPIMEEIAKVPIMKIPYYRTYKLQKEFGVYFYKEMLEV